MQELSRRTHVLLPATSLPCHRDAVKTIGNALLEAKAGCDLRVIAEGLPLPVDRHDRKHRTTTTMATRPSIDLLLNEGDAYVLIERGGRHPTPRRCA